MFAWRSFLPFDVGALSAATQFFSAIRDNMNVMVTSPRKLSREETRALLGAMEHVAQVTRRPIQLLGGAAVPQLMEALEEIREERQLTKAEIAERMMTHAPAIVRLFSAKDANPTLKTLLALLDAMGLEATLVIEPKRSAPRERRARSRNRDSVTAGGPKVTL